MTKERLQTLIEWRILRNQGANEYRLRRPMQITVRRGVIDLLKNLYPENYETGGLLEAELAGMGTLVIDRFHQVRNAASVNYHYAPDAAAWEKTLAEIVSRGNLPIALHTHPVSLGIESYDERKSTFYLKSSKADRKIAREGITDTLVMPEAIFVRDPGLENGFGLVFYTGTIFPGSITALSTVSYISGGLALLAFRRNKKLAGMAAGVGLAEFLIRRPRYRLEDNGDYVVKLVS